MGPHAIRELLHRQPFQPLRFTLTDGRTYEVQHPEMAMVGRTEVVIGLQASGETDPIHDRVVIVSLIHIMQIEPLPLSPAASPN